MDIDTQPLDLIAYLHSPQAMLPNLTCAFADGDASEIADASGTVASAHAMSHLCHGDQFRQALYKAPSSDGDSKVTSILKVIRALSIPIPNLVA
jgi:probable addiction module antidote protein